MTEASVLKGIVRVPLFGGYAGPAAFLALLVLLLLPGRHLVPRRAVEGARALARDAASPPT